MRGGRRIGSGRKKGEETKRISIPLAILPEVEKLIERHKKKIRKQLLSYEKMVDNQTPLLTKEQLIVLQQVMRECGYAKSKTEARKLTNTPKKCKNIFLKMVDYPGDKALSELGDILDLYVINS